MSHITVWDKEKCVYEWWWRLASRVINTKKRQGSLGNVRIRRFVRAIPSIVTWRSAVVIGLKICEYKSPYPDVAQTSSSFFGRNVFVLTFEVPLSSLRPHARLSRRLISCSPLIKCNKTGLTKHLRCLAKKPLSKNWILFIIMAMPMQVEGGYFMCVFSMENITLRELMAACHCHKNTERCDHSHFN